MFELPRIEITVSSGDCFSLAIILVGQVRDTHLEKLGVRIPIKIHRRRVDIQETQSFHVRYPHGMRIIMKNQLEFSVGFIYG
jgi:hypothetical protein